MTAKNDELSLLRQEMAESIEFKPGDIPKNTIEHKQLVYNVTARIVDRVWEKYADPNSLIVTKKQLKRFVKDYLGINLDESALKKVF